MKLKKDHDIFGRPINVGDWIVYGATKGRCAGVNAGKVLATKTANETYGEGKILKVQIQGVDISWGEYSLVGSGWDSKKKGKPSWLSFTDRMVVMPATWVPEFIKEMVQ